MRSAKWFLLKFADAFARLVVFVTSPVFRWIYDRAQRGLPAVSSELLMKSGLELAAMIRKRQV